MTPWISGVVAGTFLLTAMEGIVSVLLPVAMPAMPASVVWWALFSNALTASVLTGIATRSSWSGWRLTAGLFVALYVVQDFTSLIEAVFFNIFFDRATAGVLMLRELIVALAVAPGLVAIVRRFAPPRAVRRPVPFPSWLLLRVAACSALYGVLYFAFGLAIVPFIRDFYATKGLPSPFAILAMQLLVRGPIFAAVMLLVARMVNGPATTNALFGALVMSVIGGVTNLVVPNPYFPDQVRWAHFFEVTVENFIFGWVAAWLMTPAAPDRREMANVA